MNRRAFLAVLPSIALAGCAAQLGLADRVEITQKYVRLHPWDDDEPIYAAVREHDTEAGPSYRDEIHEVLADSIDDGEPIAISESVADRLRGEFEAVEFRIRGCEPETGDCRRTTLVREDFNEVEVGDIADIVFRSTGAGLVSVHERYENYSDSS
ncbi:hypothetical protein GS429_04555 [Natronorubrum sp. JWXQ-INN-674]|uniref:Uncharacterized protein n=1 Tax=Natronorubrum halalkaliphilum TaxID=2691917 RepID=A0A6B0VJS2_9EURY|nr:hypothetical protein [Natronorubrum halalkaliphilum]MXV61345.1 hypothetical protein [Natronorubrum halalkaliphilum]